MSILNFLGSSRLCSLGGIRLVPFSLVPCAWLGHGVQASRNGDGDLLDDGMFKVF